MTEHPRTTETHDLRIESAAADLWGFSLGQPLMLSREFDAWIRGYRDLGADVLAEIAAERIRAECEPA